MSLMEVMVSLGIVSIVSAVGMSVLKRSEQTVKQIRINNVMSAIARDLEASLQKPGVVAFSAYMAGNKALEDCILSHRQHKPGRYRRGNEAPDSSPTTCTATDPEAQVPLAMYHQPTDWGNIVASQMRRLKLSGTESEPVWRDVNGKICRDPREPACRIRIITYMWASCPRASDEIRANMVNNLANTPLSASCYRAQTVHFRYQVSFVPVALIRQSETSCQPFPEHFPSVPKDQVFWDGNANECMAGDKPGFRRKVSNTNNAIPIDVAQLGRYSDFVEACKTNYTMIEVRDSQPVCKCLPPYKEFKSGIRTYCQLENHTCGPEERYMGTDLEGNPQCKPVRCVTMEVTMDKKNMADFSCEKSAEVQRNGAWLSQINVPSNSGKGNCACEDLKEGPDTDIGGWYSRCNWQCTFDIVCCWE